MVEAIVLETIQSITLELQLKWMKLFVKVMQIKITMAFVVFMKK